MIPLFKGLSFSFVTFLYYITGAMDNYHEILDGIERNIEEHRTLALKLIQEHKSYTSVLRTVSKSLMEEENEALSEVDKEEIVAVLNRLQNRLDSVQICLVTHRNESQQEAIEKINKQLEDLVQMIENGSDDAQKIAESYLRSCEGGTGSKFEASLLSCTSDDQKATKKKIQTIIDNMNAIMENDTVENESVENG